MTPDKILDVARIALDLVLALVPHEDAKRLLDEAAVKRANAEADAAEALKWPNAPTEPTEP